MVPWEAVVTSEKEIRLEPENLGSNICGPKFCDIRQVTQS